MSLRDYLDVFRRRKVTIIQTFVVVMVVGLVITLLTKPLYRSTTRILVEGKALTLAQYNASDPLSSLFFQPAGHDVDTQIEVLQGDNLLELAYKKARIPLSPLGSTQRPVRVDVRPVKETDVIEIDVESHNPEYAERLAKIFPKVYSDYLTNDQGHEVGKALKYATQQLDQENAKLDQAELAMERFKREKHVSDMQMERSGRITDAIQAEADVRRAEATVAGAQARLDSLIADRNALPAYIEKPVTASNTQQISDQQDKLAQARTERQKMLLLYKPNSVQIQQKDAEIAALEARLARTPAKITTISRETNPAIASADDKISEARAALTAAQAELQKSRARAAHLTAGLGKYSAIERRLAQLQREVDQGQNNVTLLSKSVEDLSIRQVSQHDPVKIVTPANPPEQIAPRRINNLVLAALLGLTLGLGFALLQEYMDDRIHAPEEARRILGSPALGFVPLVEKEDARLIISPRSSDSLLESYRVLRSNVQFAAVDSPVRSILVTSTVPGEGKSVTASNLAVAMALDGRRVILVDADLRRPTVHQKFNQPQQPGLTNVLVGRMPLEAALQETSVPGLRILTAGPLPPNPAELLNSRAMSQLHDLLKEHADIVILDSPPCLATADAQVLSAVTDGVLYVMQFGVAKKSAVRHAIELLRQAHARVLGMVCNKIDLSAKRDDYYYSYYGYYKLDGANQLEEGKTRRRGSSDFEALLLKNGGSHSDEEAVLYRPDEHTEERI